MSQIKFWSECLSHFQSKLPQQQFSSWIKPLTCACSEDGTIKILIPNSFTLKIIQERFILDFHEIAHKYFPNFTKLELDLSSDLTIKEPSRNNQTTPNNTSILKKNSEVINFSNLNPSYQFNNYVIGKANQLAHAAAIQVAESHQVFYNPLFIYGGVGLGKTHLLQAIGNQFRVEHENPKICYIHATNYISSVVKAFQTKQFDEFKKLYQGLDLLLIDDIQFIADKSGTQQEFFYTLNFLIDSHKQVVITCDTFPKDISGIEPRLTSRFTCGLTVAIEPPSLEMRVAILLQKSISNGNPISEEVAFFTAKHVRSNVRELEGALNRINAFALFHKREINVELCREALKDLINSLNKQVSVDNIQKTVADYYRLKIIDLLSQKKSRMYSRPRQIAMSLARELTQLSLPEIGISFGNRDHSTVLHAFKSIEKLRETDKKINSEYLFLLETLKA